VEVKQANYSRAAKMRAKRAQAIDLPQVAGPKPRKKRGGARTRELELDTPTLKARAVLMGLDPNKPAILREMKAPIYGECAGRAMVLHFLGRHSLKVSREKATPQFESYKAATMAYSRYARSAGIQVHAKSQKIEMMPEGAMSTENFTPDLRSEDERDVAAARAWDIWKARMDRLASGEASAIWSAFYGWADLHHGKDLTSAGKRFVSAMWSLHEMVE
jgi:hypothetical protein